MRQPPFTGSSVHTYVEGPPRRMPGYLSLHKMTAVLMAERTPADGGVLVLGAGGGLELMDFADSRPG